MIRFFVYGSDHPFSCTETSTSHSVSALSVSLQLSPVLSASYRISLSFPLNLSVYVCYLELF